MPTAIAITFPLMMVCVLSILIAFDVILRRQYEHHREEWLASGKPCGIFYCPSETTRWRGDTKMKKLQLRWVFRAPSWIDESPATMIAIYAMRVATVIYFACFAVFAAALFRS